MKTTFRTALMASLVSAAVLTGCTASTAPVPTASTARECNAAPKKVVTLSPAEIRATLAKAAMPTPQHELLKDQVGKWNGVVKYWTDPRAKPEISQAVSYITLEHNGKFLKEAFKTTWMGRPFTGSGYTGYDTINQEFTSIWMDSASPLLSIMRGQYLPDSKSWVFKGESTCPVSGNKINTELITRIIDKQNHVFEQYTINPDGSKTMTMEISYNRAKVSVKK